jgi:hypothetical protein
MQYGKNQPSATEAAVTAAAAPETALELPTLGVPLGIPVTGGTQVGLYETLELVFTAETSPANPFDTYLLRLEVTAPNGGVRTVEGFFDGDGQGGQDGRIWKARLSPDQIGTWRWRTVRGDAADAALAGLSGEFEVIPTGLTGGLVADGRYFRYQNGQPTYLVGNFLDFSGGLRSTHTYMSETTSNEQRAAILARQTDFHQVNKVNLYLANKGDYNGQAVTPWLGTAKQNDKSRLDVARWQQWDQHLLTFKSRNMLTQLWFFADDSNFQNLSSDQINRLTRYAMARTSGFNHTLYVLALEWQETFDKNRVKAMGEYVAAHNPWQRPVSVHNLTLTGWEFSGQNWASFIASQAGNDSSCSVVNTYARDLRSRENLPHLSEEFGLLKSDSDTALRYRLWANFTGGAAGSGTGSDLAALVRFIETSRIPYLRMQPANQLLSGGGAPRYALAENGHHYLVYSEGGTFSLNLSGQNLRAAWFNPRDPKANLIGATSVASGTVSFTPPSDSKLDWVLWVTDGTNLTAGELHPVLGGAPTVIIASDVPGDGCGETVTPPTTSPAPNEPLPTITPTPEVTPAPADPEVTPAPGTPAPEVTPAPTGTPGPELPQPNAVYNQWVYLPQIFYCPR